MTGLELAVVVAASTAGACIQGSVGFGLGMVAAPVFAIVEPELMPGPLVAASIPLTFGVLLRERAAIDVGAVRWALVGRIAGTVAAALVLAVLPARPLAMLFAVLVLGAVALSVVGLTVRPTRGGLLGAGAASGFMGTATSIGGPPIVLLYQRSRGAELRASVATVLGFGAVTSLATLAVVGRYGGDELAATLVLVPGVAVGYLASGHLGRWLDRGWLRPAVLVFAAASALVLLVEQLAGG